MEKIKKEIPEKLKKLIKEQYKIGQDYFDKHLSQKRWNDKYILEPRNSEKVHVRSIFSMLQNLYSIFVIDERKVSFIASNYEWENITKMYNKLAEYDYIFMNKKDFDFIKVYYWFIYWIWATRIANWDKEENIPILESVDTMWLILDPDEIKKWTKRRFIGMKKKITVDKLVASEWYFDLWQITESEEKLKEVEIYNHYTRFEDKVYLTTWLGESCERLIKIEEFNKNSWLWDTFWFSIFIPWKIWNWQVADLIELWVEYQKMMSQISNLMLIQARKDVLGEDRVVNVNKIDIEYLSKWAPGGRNLPVELQENENLNNVIMQIPRENIWQNAGEGLRILDNLKQEATGISPITQGMVSDQNMTKWEVQTLQANANMRFSLVMTFLINSDKEFWLTWQGFYREYFNGKKNVVLDYKHKTEYYVITRKDIGKDFTVWAVRIEAKSEVNRRRKEKYQNCLAIMPNAMPYMTEENQKIFVRDIMELSGLEKEEAIAYIPETTDEILAKQDLEKINSGIEPSEPELWQNHEIFEKIFMQAIPSDIASKAIATRRALKLQEATQAQEAPTENNFWNMQNISQAQTMSKILNEDDPKNNLFTNQDIQW